MGRPEGLKGEARGALPANHSDKGVRPIPGGTLAVGNVPKERQRKALFPG